MEIREFQRKVKRAVKSGLGDTRVLEAPKTSLVGGSAKGAAVAARYGVTQKDLLQLEKGLYGQTTTDKDRFYKVGTQLRSELSKEGFNIKS